jgi:hypothetical protein
MHIETEKRADNKVILFKNQEYLSNFPYKKNWARWAMAHPCPNVAPPLESSYNNLDFLLLLFGLGTVNNDQVITLSIARLT